MPLLHTPTSLRILWNIIYHFRWIVWLNLLCSHRISWASGTSWIYLSYCLIFMSIKITFYIQPHLWFRSCCLSFDPRISSSSFLCKILFSNHYTSCLWFRNCSPLTTPLSIMNIINTILNIFLFLILFLAISLAYKWTQKGLEWAKYGIWFKINDFDSLDYG